jgi:tetratricopeptide (TPR) repeat protein
MPRAKIGAISLRFLKNGTRPTQSLRPSAIFACLTFLFCGNPPCDLQAQEARQSSSVSSSANLSQRLAIAMDARKSGDPVAIGAASRQVLALALAEMAKLRLDEKAYEEAIRLCRESLLFEDTAETRVEIAIASLYAKKPAEAAKEAYTAAEMNSQSSLAWTVKGEALLQNKDYTGASAALSRSLEIKQDAESLYALATAQLGMGARQKAAESFAQFLAQVGEFGWSRVLVGRAYQGQGLSQESEMEFQKALLLNPATPNANYFWALAILQGNGWNPKAEVFSHLQAELRLNPRHFEANYMLGSLASTAREFNESDRYLHLASEVNPAMPETWVLLGLNAQRRKSNQAAIAYFRRAIKQAKNLDPKEHFELRKAYFGLGRLLMASGRTEEGEEMLKKAREMQAQLVAENRKSLDPSGGRDEKEGMGGDTPYIPNSDFNSQPFLSLPTTKSATAAVHSKPLAGAHPRPNPEEKGEAYLAAVLGASFNDLATAEALGEKYQEAFDHYEEAARWDPRIPGLQRNLGLAAYFAGQPAEAIRLLSKVVTQTPADAHGRAVLGLAYFSSGNFAKTVQTIIPIADQALRDPQLGLAWATSQAQIGNKRTAMRALERLEASGKLPDAIEQFERTVRVEPSNLSYHLGLEAAYRKAGRAVDADQQHTICESLKVAPGSANSSTREKDP